jgi:outer membrane protein
MRAFLRRGYAGIGKETKVPSSFMGRLSMAVLISGTVISTAWPQMKIGYVDSQKILAAYPAAADVQKKIESENAAWAEELRKMNEEYRTSEQVLDQQSLLLSDAKKKEKEQELKALYVKIQDYQKQKWGEGGEIFKRQEDLLKPVYDKINSVIQRVGEAEEYDYILDTVQGQVLFAKSKYDLTDLVVKELEKEAPASSQTTQPKRN